MKVLFVMRPTTTGFSMEQIYTKLCAHLIERGVSASIYKLQSTSHFPFRDIIKLNKIDADVFHITGDINYLSTFLPWKNTINTIHDIGRYSELSGLKKFIYKLYWITFPVLTSKFIVVPSNQTKVKLLELFPSKSHKIITIQHFIGINIEYMPIKNNSTFTILHIGTKRNKNLTNLILAIQGINCLLQIVGPIGPNDSRLIKKYKINIQNYIRISDEEISSLYEKANLVSFPSFYEGFGMPILEAQLAGTPLITSRISPMKEVAGNAAHLVDPNSVSEIRDAVINVIDHPKAQHEMIENGLKNAKKYSVKKNAESHLNLYQQSLEEAKNKPNPS